MKLIAIILLVSATAGCVLYPVAPPPPAGRPPHRGARRPGPGPGPGPHPVPAAAVVVPVPVIVIP